VKRRAGRAGVGRAIVGAPSLRFAKKRHRFNSIAVGIANEGGVIALPVLRPQSGRPIAGAAGRQCGGVKGLDCGGAGRAQRNVGARIGREQREYGARIDPELGVALAEPTVVALPSSLAKPSGVSTAS